jgi:DNA-binding NarL/FixJ family response regulator
MWFEFFKMRIVKQKKHIMQVSNNPLIFLQLADQMYRQEVINYLKIYKLTNVESFQTGEELLKNMNNNPEIVIQDYSIEGISGMEVMTKAKKTNPNVEFIFFSEKDNIDTAIDCMKNGASAYIVKDKMAFQKMISNIQKINAASKIASTKTTYKLGVVLFFILLSLLIIVTIVLMINQL